MQNFYINFIFRDPIDSGIFCIAYAYEILRGTKLADLSTVVQPRSINAFRAQLAAQYFRGGLPQPFYLRPVSLLPEENQLSPWREAKQCKFKIF